MIASQSPIEFNKETAYLLEALKVESYYNQKNFTLTLQNKDFAFLEKIEKILEKIMIKPRKRILIKIRLKEKTKKEEIKITENGREINFHIEKSPFDEKKVKAVTNQPFKRKYRLKLYYKNKIFPIKININKTYPISKSELDCWIYKDLRFPTKRIFEFLEKFGGDKNKFTEILSKKDNRLIISSFNALVDAEGSIDHYGLYRRIRIRMRNKEYLKKWSKLLKRLDIGCKFRENKEDFEINISGWEDFKKLENLGFDLAHSKKSKKWKEIMKGFKRNQISRGSYKQYYTEKLKEINKKIIAKEFAKYIKKSKRVANHFLLKLEKNKLISCDRTKKPYLYFISTSSVR